MGAESVLTLRSLQRVGSGTAGQNPVAPPGSLSSLSSWGDAGGLWGAHRDLPLRAHRFRPSWGQPQHSELREQNGFSTRRLVGLNVVKLVAGLAESSPWTWKIPSHWCGAGAGGGCGPRLDLLGGSRSRCKRDPAPAPSPREPARLFLFQAFHRVVMSLAQTNVYMEGDRC